MGGRGGRRAFQHRYRQRAFPLTAGRRRDSYLRSVSAAAAPGAGFYVLVFAKGAFPADMDTATKPNEVDEDELRSSVSKYWAIDEIRSAFIHANAPRIPVLRFRHSSGMRRAG